MALPARERDIRALLATLFASRGAIMLTAGDEFGRTQHGNNNAYAQDNEITWLDWEGRNTELEAFVAALSAMRRAFPVLRDLRILTGDPGPGGADVCWLRADGRDMGVADWEHPQARCLGMLLRGLEPGDCLAIMINGSNEPVAFRLPPEIGEMEPAIAGFGGNQVAAGVLVPQRSVAFRRTRPERESMERS